MKLNEIIKIIEKEYPPELAYEWDNSGLFFGDLQKEKRIFKKTTKHEFLLLTTMKFMDHS